MRRLYGLGAVLGVAAVAAAGLVAESVLAGTGLVLLLALTSPDLRTLELRWAWRRSVVALAQCRSDQARLDVVRRREALLDELERRAPDEFEAWIDSDAMTSPIPDDARPGWPT
jgi:hypothetical protein